MNTFPPERNGVPFFCVAQAWSQHETELRAFLQKQLHDTYQTDDLLQEVFVKAMQQGNRFCSLDNPRAWLFRVARNTVTDHFRAHKVGESLSDELIAPHSDPEPLDLLAERIDEILPQLEAQDQDILRSCDLQGLRQQDYADAHGLSLTATKSRLLRARQRLREHLVRQLGVRLDEVGTVCCHADPVKST